MGSHRQEETFDMIPRVTVRDTTDAELLKQGLVELSKKVTGDYRLKAATADTAEQLSLTLEMNDHIQTIMGLLRAVGDGTMSGASATTDTEKE
jgi:hypothetical protein